MSGNSTSKSCVLWDVVFFLKSVTCIQLVFLARSHRLKKIGSRFLLLSEGQLRVELPENVEMMMASL